jgi:hypothetical protein
MMSLSPYHNRAGLSIASFEIRAEQARPSRRYDLPEYRFVVRIEPEETGLPERSAVNCAQIAAIQLPSNRSDFVLVRY